MSGRAQDSKLEYLSCRVTTRQEKRRRLMAPAPDQGRQCHEAPSGARLKVGVIQVFKYTCWALPLIQSLDQEWLEGSRLLQAVSVVPELPCGWPSGSAVG